MQSHRIISGLTILMMLVLVVVGYLLVAQPQLAAANTANDSLTTVNGQIASSQATLAHLKIQQKKLPSLKAQVAKLRLSIPVNADISAYIDALNALAGSTGVSISSIKVDTALPYIPPAAPVGAVAPAAGGSATPSPTPSASTAPVAPVAPTAWSPTTDPLITAANFVAIPVTVTTSGEWPATQAFIKGLQTGTRLYLVTGITTSVATAATGTGGITAVITGYIYVLLDPKGAALDKHSGTASPTPTPTPTPTVSVSPNPSGSSTPTPTTSPTP
jgi:hypothetical protein